MTEVKPQKQNALEGFFRHQRRAVEHTGKAIFNLVPREARRHGRAAIREGLLSFRVLINDALDVLEDDSSSARRAASGKPGKKIKVEVQ